MEAENKVMKVFWGVVSEGNGILHTWLYGTNRASYELKPGKWREKKEAIELAKRELKNKGGGTVEIYSQGGSLSQTIGV